MLQKRYLEGFSEHNFSRIRIVFFYLALTNSISLSVLMDLGLSIGRPRARDQTRDARTPRARDIPNRTV